MASSPRTTNSAVWTGAFDRSPPPTTLATRGRESGPALHHDVHERTRPARTGCWPDASEEGATSSLRTSTTPGAATSTATGRALHAATRGAGPVVRTRLALHALDSLDEDFVTGNNDADGVPAAVGERPPRWHADLRARLQANGAATPAASTWPTSTTWAMCTPTPCGGTTTWAAYAAAVLGHLG